MKLAVVARSGYPRGNRRFSIRRRVVQRVLGGKKERRDATGERSCEKRSRCEGRGGGKSHTGRRILFMTGPEENFDRSGQREFQKEEEGKRKKEKEIQRRGAGNQSENALGGVKPSHEKNGETLVRKNERVSPVFSPYPPHPTGDVFRTWAIRLAVSCRSSRIVVSVRNSRRRQSGSLHFGNIPLLFINAFSRSFPTHSRFSPSCFCRGQTRGGEIQGERETNARRALESHGENSRGERKL